MKYIFELNHPKHYYQFKFIMRQLREQGHQILVLARDKDVLLQLLQEEGVEYRIFGQHRKNLRDKILETPKLIFRYLSIARQWKPDVIISKASFYGCVVAKLVHAKSVIFPDSEVVKVTNRYVVPLASMVITPACFALDFGHKHHRIQGFFEDCYLAPSVCHTAPVLHDSPYAVLRFVGWFANHDVNNSGFSLSQKKQLIDAIRPYMKVYISSEKPLPDELQQFRLPTPANQIHSVLAYADLYLGDSQTMATEAALLGCPAIRSNSFVGPDDMTNFRVLEQQYGLLRNIRSFADLLPVVQDMAQHSRKADWLSRRQSYFASVGDANAQILSLLSTL